MGVSLGGIARFPRTKNYAFVGSETATGSNDLTYTFSASGFEPTAIIQISGNYSITAGSPVDGNTLAVITVEVMAGATSLFTIASASPINNISYAMDCTIKNGYQYNGGTVTTTAIDMTTITGIRFKLFRGVNNSTKTVNRVIMEQMLPY
jgi:hypothetical protein